MSDPPALDPLPMGQPQTITDLVARFTRNERAYLSDEYNEEDVRTEFIDPLFKALGWDVDNTLGHAEPYKDVVREHTVVVGDGRKAPDYSFRIGGTRNVFVEAKKPALNLKTDAEAAFQLRRYAWSAKPPLSILTSFREFAVYDCRIEPSVLDKASTRRALPTQAGRSSRRRC